MVNDIYKELCVSITFWYCRGFDLARKVIKLTDEDKEREYQKRLENITARLQRKVSNKENDLKKTYDPPTPYPAMLQAYQ